MNLLAVFFSGVLFAIGLVVSGMTLPDKVIGFLDVFGAWDPDLALVMGGALLVNAPLLRLTLERERPLLAEVFHLPQKMHLEPRLIAGSALFGIGWGLGGYCPGPALASVAGGTEALAFVGSMLVGMVVHDLVQAARGGPDQPAEKRSSPLRA